MKVKFINKEEYLGLEYWQEYDVFAILIGKSSFINKESEEQWQRFYIKAKWPKYIYPYNMDDFKIIESNLPQNWIFWLTQLWDYYLWPKEVFLIEDFWDRYYNDDEKCFKIINCLI